MPGLSDLPYGANALSRALFSLLRQPNSPKINPRRACILNSSLSISLGTRPLPVFHLVYVLTKRRQHCHHTHSRAQALIHPLLYTHMHTHGRVHYPPHAHIYGKILSLFSPPVAAPGLVASSSLGLHERNNKQQQSWRLL